MIFCTSTHHKALQLAQIIFLVSLLVWVCLPAGIGPSALRGHQLPGGSYTGRFYDQCHLINYFHLSTIVQSTNYINY